MKNFDDYTEQLAKNFVVLDSEKRRALIVEQAEKIASLKNCRLKPDEKLLEEVTGLVEWPEVMAGNIDKDFMHLPGESLSTSMKAHQKYFSLLDKDGKLAPFFVVVSNIKASDGGKEVIAGNERVLRARLSDAKFFFEQDTKQRLETRVKDLAGVTFHAKLGSYLDKTKRITELAKYIAPNVKDVNVQDAEKAAILSKADLLSGMVGEFPELQGIMGGYYATSSGENSKVSTAIREHYYYPVTYNYDGTATKNPTSLVVAIADKTDSLVGLYSAGEKPTGSKDPFALRRAALSIISMVVDNGIRLPLWSLLEKSQSLFPNNLHKQEVIKELLDFFAERLKQKMKETSIRHDFINAVFDGRDTDLYRLTSKINSLDGFLKTEDGKSLLAGYRRAANIVSAEEKKDKTTYRGEPDEKLMKLEEEKKLYKSLSSSKAEINSNLEKKNSQR